MFISDNYYMASYSLNAQVSFLEKPKLKKWYFSLGFESLPQTQIV